MITKKEVENVAKLSRLTFTEEEKLKLEADLNDMLSYMEILNKVDVSGVLDVSRPIGSMREDEVKESISPELLLKNAPKKVGSAFVVPHVLD